MNYTILGNTGFIGSHLVASLKAQSIPCITPPREYVPNKRKNLGHVIYCIGLTADFRKKPFATVEAHITKLAEFLHHAKFESFLYLSATRLYNHHQQAIETASITANPTSPNDLYNISKMAGEALCLSIPNNKIRVARISNVIGNDFKSENFLYSIIKEAVTTKKLILRSPLTSHKDYIAIEDVIAILPRIAREGKERIYNVASGKNITHGQIIKKLVKQTHCTVEVLPGEEQFQFPRISITRLQKEFSFQPRSAITRIEELIKHYAQEKTNY